MTQSRYRWAVIGLLMLVCSGVQAAMPFVAGKHYVELSAKVRSQPGVKALLARDQGKIEVLEFFSYGCPACRAFDPTLQKWLKNKPKDVRFRRVPVIFHKSWRVFAKAYYTAQALGIGQAIHEPLFKALHEQKRDLSTQQAMAGFFVEHGVPADKFNALFSSFSIDNEVTNAEALLRQYQLFEVPTVIVAGRYRTNYAMVEGKAKRFSVLLDKLIEKSREKKQQAVKSKG